MTDSRLADLHDVLDGFGRIAVARGDGRTGERGALCRSGILYSGQLAKESAEEHERRKEEAIELSESANKLDR